MRSETQRRVRLMNQRERFEDRRNEDALRTVSATGRKYCTCPACGTQITVGGGEACSLRPCPSCQTMMGDFTHYKPEEGDMNAKWGWDWS